MSKPCSHHGINILKTSPQIPPKPRGESKQNSVLPYLSQQAILHPGNNLSVFESHSLLHSGWDIVSRTVDINVGVNGCLCVYVALCWTGCLTWLYADFAPWPWDIKWKTIVAHSYSQNCFKSVRLRGSVYCPLQAKFFFLLYVNYSCHAYLGSDLQNLYMLYIFYTLFNHFYIISKKTTVN